MTDIPEPSSLPTPDLASPDLASPDLASPDLAPPDLAPVLRPIVFTEPDRLVPPTAWVGHLPFAFWLIDVLRPRVFVELGVHSGNSYCGFCQAVRTLAVPTHCYGVDSWRGDPQAGFYGGEVLADLRAWHDARYAGFSRLVHSSFDDALAHFPDGSIDLLHIDGYHTYEAVAHDAASWRPKLSPRAVVLLHDTNVREGDFGVWRLWPELAAGRPHFTFLHGNGLGVLATGSVDSAPLDWLFAAGAREAVAIRALFARLGGAVEARQALIEGERVPAREIGVADRQQLAAARDALAVECERLTSQVETQRSEIGDLVAEVVARDRRLAAKQEALETAEDHHQAAIRALHAQAEAYVAGQNETVERLHGLAAAASAQRDAVGRALEALRDDYRALEASARAGEADRQALRDHQAETEAQLEAQNQAVAQWHSRAADIAAERDAVGRALETLRGDYQALASDRATLEAALASVQASTSWRLTAPLRALTRLVKRG